VQRFGRVNRRRRMETLARVQVFTKPDDGQNIYDPRLISRTIQILRRENGKPIDENKVGSWLDEIYKDDIADLWQEEFQKITKGLRMSASTLYAHLLQRTTIWKINFQNCLTASKFYQMTYMMNFYIRKKLTQSWQTNY